MGNFKINPRKCPLCPGKKSDYVYKTCLGLQRHIWKWHVRTKKGHYHFEEPEGEIKYLRKFFIRFSRYQDIPVHGRTHVEAIIDTICKGKLNPSLRMTGIQLEEGYLGRKTNE